MKKILLLVGIAVFGISISKTIDHSALKPVRTELEPGGDNGGIPPPPPPCPFC